MSDEIEIKTKSKKSRIIIVTAVILIAVVTVAAVIFIPKQATAKKVNKQLSLGEKYLSELNYEQAIAAYEAAIKIDPKCADAYLGLAEIYEEMGDFEKAEKVLKDARDAVEDEGDLDRILRKRKRIQKKQEEKESITPAPNPTEEPTVPPTPTLSPTPEPTITPIPEPSEEPVPTVTPAPIVFFRGHSYSFITAGDMTWEDIKAYCEAAGGYPASILSAEENEFLYNQMVEQGYSSAYFGYTDEEIEGEWKWFTRETSDYTNWYYPELDNYQEEDYAMFWGNIPAGTWNDGGLRHGDAAFICEWGDLAEAPSPTPTTEPEIESEPVLTITPTVTPTPTPTVTPTPTPTPTVTPTPRPKISMPPSITPKPQITVPPTVTPVPKPIIPTISATPTPKVAAIVNQVKNASIGSFVTFGTYEQDNNFNNGAEDIEWVVLDKKDGRALVLSKNVLDARPSDDKGRNVSWENSSLREWLNSEFYKNTFSGEEQESIVEMVIYDTETGKDTKDKVFLLSGEEVVTYSESNANKSKIIFNPGITKYAKAQNKNLNIWWIRCAAEDVKIAYDFTTTSTNSKNGVRPALWIAYTPEGAVAPTPTPAFSMSAKDSVSVIKSYQGTYNATGFQYFELRIMSCDEAGTISAIFSYYDGDDSTKVLGSFQMEGRMLNRLTDGSLIAKLKGVNWTGKSDSDIIGFEVTFSPDRNKIWSEKYELYGIYSNASQRYSAYPILNSYSGSYVSNWGNTYEENYTGLNLYMLSCNDKTGEVEAIFAFYKPNEASLARTGQYTMKGNIVYEHPDGTLELDMRANEWLDKPPNTVMRDFTLFISKDGSKAYSDDLQIDLVAQ